MTLPLRTPFLQSSSSGCFRGLTRVFKVVRNRNRRDCQRYIPDSAEKRRLPRKSAPKGSFLNLLSF